MTRNWKGCIMINIIKEKFFTRKFLSFAIIGAINTFVAIGLYMLFVTLGVNVGVASFLGDGLTMILSYFMNTIFTYRQKPSLKSAVTFPLSYIPGMIISAAVTLIVVNVFHGPKMWAKAIALPIYFPVNFLCMSFIMKRFGKPGNE